MSTVDLYKSTFIVVPGSFSEGTCVMWKDGAVVEWDTSDLANKKRLLGVIQADGIGGSVIKTGGLLKLNLADGVWYCDSTGQLVNALPVGSFNHYVGESSGGWLKLLTIIDDPAIPGTLGSVYQSQPADPTGTTSATGVMMGLAGSITPSTTGRSLIIISGICHNSVGPNGGLISLRTGIGAVPTNGGALIGTVLGNPIDFTMGDATGVLVGYIEPYIPFSVQAVVTGLTMVANWVDLSLARTGGGGTASVKDISISIVEI